MKFQNIITKIVVTYLSRRFIVNKILVGALQGFNLVPILFKISISDWFTVIDEITVLPITRLVAHHKYCDTRLQILTVLWKNDQ